MQKFQTIMGMVFIFVIFGTFVGDYLGLRPVIATTHECYDSTKYDESFSYICAGLGLVLGSLIAWWDNIKSLLSE